LVHCLPYGATILLLAAQDPLPRRSRAGRTRRPHPQFHRPSWRPPRHRRVCRPPPRHRAPGRAVAGSAPPVR